MEEIKEIIARKDIKSENLNEIFTALAKAQGEMKTAGFTKQNPFFKSKYADLAELVRVSRPALTKYGLSVCQLIVMDSEGHKVLHTLLGHSSGQWLESRVRVSPPKSDIQAMGSYITYLKRYSYSALVGVCVSDEDDDGEMAMDVSRKSPTPVSPNDKVTKEQLEELQHELSKYPALEKEVMSKLKISNLADLPKNKYRASLDRIREIKQLKIKK